MRVLEILTRNVASVRRNERLVMTPDPITATSDEDVGEVLRRMRVFGVRRVPVVDAIGALEGLVSIDDVLAGLSEELAQAASLVARQRERESERRP